MPRHLVGMMVHAISEGRGPDPEEGCWFTPVQATSMLPLVRQIAGDLLRLHASIESQRAQLRGLADVEEISDRSTYSEELRDIRASLAEEEGLLQGCLAELATLGVEPHLPIDGGIDFPAKLNRRVVRLCWTPGDREVAHWHEIGQPLAARRRLDPRVPGETPGGRGK